MKIIKGILTGKNYYRNKVGKQISSTTEYFLEVDGKSFFIKLLDSKINAAALAPLIGQTIQIEGAIKHGLWDTNNPNHQSRVGDYICIQVIL